jgi:hypothetical protein
MTTIGRKSMLAATLVAVALGSAALAAEKRHTAGVAGKGNAGVAVQQFKAKPGASATGAVHDRSNTVVDLSISECTNLGGSLFLTSVCKTGHACQTTDESNNVHMVCISEIK